MRTILLIGVLLVQQAWPAHVRTSPPRPVAIVNGTALMSDRLQAVVNMMLPAESFHQKVSAEKAADVRRRALAQIVDEELQYQDALARGIQISPREIDAGVSELAKGYPSRAAFSAAMTKAGATPDGVRAELRRKLLIATVSAREVTARCPVAAGEARRYFAEHPEKFVEPERLHLRAITIAVDPSTGASGWTAGRDRAEMVLREVIAGLTFEAAARKYSTDASASKGGDIGTLHRGSLNPGFERAASVLKPGEVSGVIESIYGYHLIQLVEVLPPRPRGFDEVGVRLQADLTAERCESMRLEWLSRLRKRAAIEYPQ